MPLFESAKPCLKARLKVKGLMEKVDKTFLFLLSVPLWSVKWLILEFYYNFRYIKPRQYITMFHHISGVLASISTSEQFKFPAEVSEENSSVSAFWKRLGFSNIMSSRTVRLRFRFS